MNREEAAEEYIDNLYKGVRLNDFQRECAIKDFLAGCEHADKEHRDFYLLVREYFKEDVWREAKEHSAIFTKIEKHLAAFTERDLSQLPFKD